MLEQISKPAISIGLSAALVGGSLASGNAEAGAANKEQQRVAAIAGKIIKLFRDHQSEIGDTSVRTTRDITNYTVKMPSVYGRYVLSASIIKGETVSPETVRKISIIGYLPGLAQNAQPKLGGSYLLSLNSNGSVGEARANYINGYGKAYYYLDYSAKSGIYAQLYSSEYPAFQNITLKDTPVFREHVITDITDTLQELSVNIPKRMPVDPGTISPVSPLFPGRR